MNPRAFLQSASLLTAYLPAEIVVSAVFPLAKTHACAETLLIVSRNRSSNLDIHGIESNVLGRKASWNCCDRRLSRDGSVSDTSVAFFRRNAVVQDLTPVTLKGVNNPWAVLSPSAISESVPSTLPNAQEDFMDVDIPEVKEEVEAAHRRYEAALVSNDIETLEVLFRDDNRTIRYGGSENLYGIDEIRAFRRARSPLGLARHLERTVITTYGRDYGVASTLFYRDAAPRKVGRQMQSWVRFPEGWRIVAAHVSLIDE
jgi:hypothetical protein